MRVFLTGSSGFIGSHVLRRLVQDRHEVAILLRPTSNPRRIADILAKVRVIRGDLDDLDAVTGGTTAFAPEAILHMGWFGVTGPLRNDPRQVRNIAATVALVELARRAGVSHWIGLGSQAEYGRLGGPVEENGPAQPKSLYGITKLSSCLLARHLCAAAGIRFAWLRVFSVYGPGDDPSCMLPSVILKLLRRERPALTAGEQLWDYLYVGDAAEAVARVLTAPSAEGIFNLGSGRVVTIRGAVERVRDRIDPGLPIGFGEVPYGPDQVMRLQADVTRLRLCTGWAPSVDLDEGLWRTVDWFRAQEYHGPSPSCTSLDPNLAKASTESLGSPRPAEST